MKALLAFEVFLCLTLCSARTARDQQQAPSGYDKYERPAASIEVGVGISVRNLEYVSTVDRKYKCQLLVRTTWIDERLAHTSKEEYLSYPVDQVWIPDVIFENELNPSQLRGALRDDSKIRVGRSGMVHLNQRVSAEFACPMDLQNFPYDIQKCPLIITSWTASLPQLQLMWNPQPVVVYKHAFSVSDFALRSFETENCTSTTPIGVYSCLQVNLTLKRMITPYVIRLYAPMIVCVVVASLSFWIQCSPVRIVVLMIDLLGAAAIEQVAAHTSTFGDYTTYIDIFSGVSIAFVLLSLLEFVVVQSIFKRELMSEKLHSMMNDIRSNGLDITCRIIMPLLYAFFVTAYFAVAFFLLDDEYPPS
ncbi:glutamate-gated chloride channel [Galendromus occidentalis]|uniref:Glutamate-gated chloride channel n=1 Tax=Galendromus occidentalis TaxID=34638 RepID=A0AAJ7L6A4_9ACAR|nr:glutamate-gated chloride channel [Galendromus occidentalis]